MTTSWESSTDDHNDENISSSTDKNEYEDKHDQISSEDSLFSDSDIQQQQEEKSNTSALVQFERGPSFLMPTL